MFSLVENRFVQWNNVQWRFCELLNQQDYLLFSSSLKYAKMYAVAGVVASLILTFPRTNILERYSIYVLCASADKCADMKNAIAQLSNNSLQHPNIRLFVICHEDARSVVSPDLVLIMDSEHLLPLLFYKTIVPMLQTRPGSKIAMLCEDESNDRIIALKRLKRTEYCESPPLFYSTRVSID